MEDLQPLANLAQIVGGFATAIAAVFAIVGVPLALIQIRSQQRETFVQIYYQAAREFSTSGMRLLEALDQTYRGHLEIDPSQKALAAAREGILDITIVNILWDKCRSDLMQALSAYTRAGRRLQPTDLAPLKAMLDAIDLNAEVHVERDIDSLEHVLGRPLAYPGSLQIFLGECFDIRSEVQELLKDKRLIGVLVRPVATRGGAKEQK